MKNRIISKALCVSMIATMGLWFPQDIYAAENENEYIVAVNNDSGYEDFVEDHEDAIIETSENSSILTDQNMAVVAVTDSEAIELQEDTNIIIEPNYTLQASVADVTDEDGAELEVLPEDSLWHLDMMNVDSSENADSDAAVKVALLDTGVSPGSALNLTDSINLIPGEESVEPLFDDLSGHGTALAQIIGAEDIGNGMTGVNPGVQLASVKVLRDDMTGSISQVVEGIYWCIQNDVDVINMSFGMNADSEILHRAIRDAYTSGVTLVAAAGNGGNDCNVEYPAAYDEVIAVGSVDANGQISDFSATGGEMDVTAPGEYVPSVDMLDYVKVTDGTSVSSAEVTGVVSKLLEEGSSSPEYIREVLKKSAKSQDAGDGDNTDEAGIVDAGYATSMYTEYEGDESQLDMVPYGTNNDAVQTCEEDVIARFNKDNHTAVLNDIENFEATVDEATLYKGLRCPDIDTYRGFINDLSTNATLSGYREAMGYDSEGEYKLKPTNFVNGFRNAVANTMYMYNLAKAIDDSGNANYFPTLSHPMDGYTDTKEHNKDFIQWCMAKLNEHWTNPDFGFTGNITAHKKAMFILGMSMHNAMDMYAHRAVYKNNGVLTPVDKADRDDINKYPDRYTVAKAVARKIYAHWKNTDNGTRKAATALVFKVSQHNVASSMNNGFSIVTYYTYVRFTGENLSDDDKDWFRLRAARINQDELWHTVSSNKVAMIDASTNYNNWRKSDYVGP